MLLLSALALADIPPTPPVGKQFATNTVTVEGVADHPDFVLLLYADRDKLSEYRAFTPDNNSTEVDGALLSADFWVMGREGYVTWAAQTREEIMRQRTACAERGEGCAHISRFSPSFPPPSAAVKCGTTLSAPHAVPDGQPTRLTHTFRLTAASADGCTLAAAGSTEAPAVDEPEAAPAAGDDAPSSTGGCAVVSGASLGAVVLSGFLGLRRRCGS